MDFASVNDLYGKSIGRLYSNSSKRAGHYCAAVTAQMTFPIERNEH
jgi:hypothetical protein